MSRRRKLDTSQLVTDPLEAMAVMIGIPDVKVLSLSEDGRVLHVSLESSIDEVTCPTCGEGAVADGRRVVTEDATAFGKPVEMSWRLRRWRCSSTRCRATWSEEVPRRPQRGTTVARSDQSGRPA